MPTLNIKDPSVHQMARELAALTGSTMTEAIRTALKKSIEQERARKVDKSRLLARGMELSRQIAAMPDLDTRTADEILGYNEYGVPE